MSQKQDVNLPIEFSLVECRTCLQALDNNSVLVDLFQCWVPPWDGMGMTIAEDLTKLTNVQITVTDNYSKVICESCCIKLQKACDFACSVRKIDTLLRQRPVPKEMESINRTVWQPIKSDKTIPGDFYGNLVNIEIKEEIDVEHQYAYNTEMDDPGERLAIEIKIEPEEFIPPTLIHAQYSEDNPQNKEILPYTPLNELNTGQSVKKLRRRKNQPLIEQILAINRSSESMHSVNYKSVLRKQRNQRYRDKHLERINQRRRENRRNRQLSLQSIASSSSESSVQQVQHEEVPSEQAAKIALRKERDRLYRERNREEIKQRRRERKQHQINMQSIVTESMSKA